MKSNARSDIDRRALLSTLAALPVLSVPLISGSALSCCVVEAHRMCAVVRVRPGSLRFPNTNMLHCGNGSFSCALVSTAR
jgi:hypothetical protein